MDTKELETFLKKNRMIGEEETYQGVCKRIFGAITRESEKYDVGEKQIGEMEATLIDMFKQRKFVPSTPIITNAGRYEERPLTACSVPPLDARMNRNELEKMVNQYHKKGMGTGFNFDDAVDPVTELLFFNANAVAEFERKEMDRPIGNMGILSIDHPQVLNFAGIKAGKFRNHDWKFNISVNLKDDFMKALALGEQYKLKDGTIVNPEKLLDDIVAHAHNCGDPGLVFLDRFEQYNITPHLGKYVSLAPCGEVPMASGETCQFSYVNLGAFVDGNAVDYEGLKDAVHKMVLMLDNALDISISNFENEKSTEIMSRKRKIGVGVCGFSDMLFSLGIQYDSEEARGIAEDVMSLVNYESKKASVELAKERGAFPAFHDTETKRELITERYLGNSSNTVSSKDWEQLRDDINQYGIRHVSTIALPPTGRSSMVIGASASIEPAFSLANNESLDGNLERHARENNYNGNMLSVYVEIDRTGSVQETDLPQEVKDIYKTCLELSPEAHLLMVATFQKYTDDSISKTINLPNNATADEIKKTYVDSYELGLKGITVYRDGCKQEQPKALKYNVGVSK